jgi:predicted Zn-dependent protease with MMP-like domain
VATVDGGLQITGQPEPIPAGKVIDSSWFVVEPVNGVEGPEQALRSAFVAFDESAPHRAVDDLVDDVTLSMAAAYDGTADEEAELGRITLEHDLDEAASERWQSVALAALAAVRGLLGDDMGPASPLSPTRAGIEVSRERFGELVVEALDSIPPELARRMENVAVIVEDEAEGGRLFGLYRGVPLTKRTGYGHAVPDLITIYQTTISQYSDTESEIVAQVRRTVIHEVAHHFGISDPRLRELGW